MLPVWRDIAVFFDASSAGEKIALHAAQLARKHEAHLVGIYGVSLTGEMDRFAGNARGEAIRHVVERRRNEEEQKVIAAGRWFANLSGQFAISSELRIVWRDGLDTDAVLRTLHSDVIIAAHPKPDDLPTGWLGERLLLATGTPVLLIPQSWTGETLGTNVLIAWNRSREARRAVNDAMPFISTAEKRTILTVDAAKNMNDPDQEAGTNLLQHLNRYNVEADIAKVASDGSPVADVIVREVAERRVDLLVFGAYSRPRTTELLFGSTTRSLLATGSVPMLISR
ncbi:universal stress protein [Pseudorhizobium flavum]|jgi:nucleotide-binding universal stress UspA family protein|uniref:Nucleotide-binding universal stress UspA family protein n=1 Tax=Pseudorhizobium flavum TaxID=1335061 RepID=A0A7W9Z261_9HYPH|nr:universal stress protein [Pseudorhizobium flavum]MBB6182542.1 nucleotide-binding universal stress UspA family protein [Pseudorhizobium flavum]CAD6628903.1 universal stress protein UspA [Pseudorhizobium flavum]